MAARSATDQGKGLAMAVLGVLILTPDTLIIRLVDIDPWTFLFWRGGLMFFGFVVLFAVRYRLGIFRQFYRIGWFGLGAAMVFTINAVCFQLSVQNTQVANTLVIIAMTPLFAALLSWPLLGERVARHTWVAIGICLLAVLAIFAGDLDFSGGVAARFGDLAAVMAAFGLGGFFVMTRIAKDTDFGPAVALSGPITALIGLLVAPGLLVTPPQLQLLLVLGLAILPASFWLLTLAPRYIPAPEVSLVLLLETLLGPLWVWLVIAEEPPFTTLVGGAVIVSVLTWHSLVALRSARQT
ncbi:MAG: DMT family transporter [Rhodospirillaceae bacterium]|nr:DMT family transporter [Rhodospirillaceae bacterium]MBT6139389.1 DMT family transporter [Rhodospirillaceae bacterium]